MSRSSTRLSCSISANFPWVGSGGLTSQTGQVGVAQVKYIINYIYI